MQKEILLYNMKSRSMQKLTEAMERSGYPVRVVLPSYTAKDIDAANTLAIVISGSPEHLYGKDYEYYDPEAPTLDKEIFSLGIPVLGICYGAQLIAQTLGGNNIRSEYGREKGDIKAYLGKSVMFGNEPHTAYVGMNHMDRIETIPKGYTVTAFTRDCPIAAFESAERKIVGLQFHPEITRDNGDLYFDEFFRNVCGVDTDYVV